MKNGLIIWNVLLTLVAGYLLISHFGSGKKPASINSNGNSDTTFSGKQFRIAYFEMDSIEANFGMVKDVMAELSKKELAINEEMNKLTKNLQQRFNFYQNKAQAGSLSQADSEVASQEMKILDDQLKNRKQQLDQEYSDFMVRRQSDIKVKIEDFLKEYNQNKNYSYIVSYDQGVFYFRDTTYNITVDLVKGLNERYTSTKK